MLFLYILLIIFVKFWLYSAQILTYSEEMSVLPYQLFSNLATCQQLPF